MGNACLVLILVGVGVRAYGLYKDAQQQYACHKCPGAEIARDTQGADLVGAEGYDICPNAHETNGQPGPACAVHFSAYGTACGKTGGTQYVEQQE